MQGVEDRRLKILDGFGGQNGWPDDLMGMQSGQVDALFVGSAGR